ncbi:MAG: hypothetical protein ACK559_25655, partial [bacterium]
EEVVVGELLAVRPVGVLRDGRAARPVGRVADHEPEPAGRAGTLLTDPALEGRVGEVEVGPQRLQHERRERGPLDGVPRQPGDGLERADEPADAGRGFEGVDGVAVLWEGVD